MQCFSSLPWGMLNGLNNLYALMRHHIKNIWKQKDAFVFPVVTDQAESMDIF